LQERDRGGAGWEKIWRCRGAITCPVQQECRGKSGKKKKPIKKVLENKREKGKNKGSTLPHVYGLKIIGGESTGNQTKV